MSAQDVTATMIERTPGWIFWPVLLCVWVLAVWRIYDSTMELRALRRSRRVPGGRRNE